MAKPTGQERTVMYESLRVVVHDSAEHLAGSVARRAGDALRQAISARGRAAVLLATGNSQLGFLARLGEEEIAWSKVSVLHLDEYVGLPAGHPASFRRYLNERVVEPLKPGAFYGLRGDAADMAEEIARYRGLLEREKPDLCVLGVGENGHLAFNDPPADFETNAVVHEVTLDMRCRQQQVDEGHFADIDAVPARALTLTVPALLSCPEVIAIVPERRKAAAVRAMLEGPVSPHCPASVLRTVPYATLHLDPGSASLLGGPAGAALRPLDH